ncbi:CRISPR-associated endonuclease Cas2 [Methylomonas rapida]|jgi:CRISPR-associated endoribonuclease Cas2|uniref:CRISPR-associated endoribonuclease Cas2 n=1 Tax=Methylomonas rapida TaxID=2963939 RepID=A0ABY7GF95_9GAMM|nr:CRISPR-associated endonuclease Cas2 [Methylomonas rapida]WAR43667.1 CRISPR-associated endonuclease Cas2 [Methylomonas rapida]
MADSRLGLYLIAYDIADPRRLSKVHRILKKEGLPVQYSVFTVVMKRPRMLRLLERIDAQILQLEDDVRCYRLPENSEANTLGRQYFPDDVMLFTGGVNRLLSG